MRWMLARPRTGLNAVARRMFHVKRDQRVMDGLSMFHVKQPFGPIDTCPCRSVRSRVGPGCIGRTDLR